MRLIFIVVLSALVSLHAGAHSVPAGRLERLTKGINLSHWMAQWNLTQEHVRAYFTQADARLIAEMGFRHARLTLNPQPFWNDNDPAQLNPERLAMLDHGIDMLAGAGLAVIVDIHPEGDFKERLAKESEFSGKFAKFWGALAKHLSHRDPRQLFLEVMNEPRFPKGAEWEAIQNEAVAAMRAAAPNHTIIVTGGEWGSLDNLLELKPLADENIVYNFHFYEPMHFSHQGATWGYEYWRFMSGVPYPFDAAAMEKILPAIENERARNDLRWLARAPWNRAAIRERLAKAAGWGKAHDVPVTCNEFGVYARVAPRESRLAWLRDVRGELEALQIGWCMWDYAGGFKVVDREKEKRTADEGVLAALGLKENGQ